jgi:hypothetical protein
LSDLMAAFRAAADRQMAGDLPAAEAAWRAILRDHPESPEGWANLAGVLWRLDAFEEAGACRREAARLRPEAVWAQRGLAEHLHAVGEWAEARGAYEAAIAAGPPDPRMLTDFGHLLLGLGDYARGWPLYENRKGLPGRGCDPPPLQGEWLGEPLAGRSLLVWPEQGFGDMIQFARFLPALRTAGADVTFVTPPQLLRLFSGLGVRLVPHTGSTKVPAPDAWTMIASVPHRLGITLDTLPSQPYLAPPSSSPRAGMPAPGPGSVAIAWRGRPTHPNDRWRSLPHDLLSPLVAQRGLQPVDLSGPYSDEDDFADVASVLQSVELVVTVDTALAHLAGALGRPCWVLLPWRRQDWRWLKGRADSPWYPSVRLFRQPRLADWGPVLDDVGAALSAWRQNLDPGINI